MGSLKTSRRADHHNARAAVCVAVILSSDVDVAEGQLAIAARREKDNGEQPGIEYRHNDHDRQTGNGAKRGAVDGIAKGADEPGPDTPGLEAGGRYFDHPGQ